MVCNRCKTVVLQLLEKQGLNVKSIELGEVVIKEDPNIDTAALHKALKEHGFELITEASEALVEKIKMTLIQQLEKDETENVLPQLANQLGKNYSALSKLFSKSEGITLEKYLINLKIEKVKEHILLKQLNFSDIAHSLNYKNSSHLAKQFKNVTGMSMSDYKNLQDVDRKA